MNVAKRKVNYLNTGWILQLGHSRLQSFLFWGRIGPNNRPRIKDLSKVSRVNDLPRMFRKKNELEANIQI